MTNGSVFAHLTAPELKSYAELERFIVFCDGFGDAGHEVYAAHGRKIARDAIRTLENLDAERSARRAMQAARDRALDRVARQALEERSGVVDLAARRDLSNSQRPV